MYMNINDYNWYKINFQVGNRTFICLSLKFVKNVKTKIRHFAYKNEHKNRKGSATRWKRSEKTLEIQWFLEKDEIGNIRQK